MTNTVKTNTVKERIAADLQKAKAEGGLRADRIKGIVQLAVAQAVTELKGGSGELRGIVQDAIAAVTETLGDRTQDAKAEVTATVEGVVEGISRLQRDAIAVNRAKVDQLQAELDDQEQRLDAEIGGALATIESSFDEADVETTPKLKSMIASAVNAIKERDEFAGLRQQYMKLQAKLEVLEVNLAARYGDRYDDAKQHLENAKVWYAKTRGEAQLNGPTAVETKQVEVETKLGEAGVALAQKEEQVKAQIKQSLKELWQAVTKL